MLHSYFNFEVEYESPSSCKRCGYFSDCVAYWRFCPYDGKLTSEKRPVEEADA